MAGNAMLWKCNACRPLMTAYMALVAGCLCCRRSSQPLCDPVGLANTPLLAPAAPMASRRPPRTLFPYLPFFPLLPLDPDCLETKPELNYGVPLLPRGLHQCYCRPDTLGNKASPTRAGAGLPSAAVSLSAAAFCRGGDGWPLDPGLGGFGAGVPYGLSISWLSAGARRPFSLGSLRLNLGHARRLCCLLSVPPRLMARWLGSFESCPRNTLFCCC